MQSSELADRRALRGVKPEEVRLALDAVCREMGIRNSERARRAAVARSIQAAWAAGRTQPLNLVDAGIRAA
jgi:hypothetical protein